MTYKSIIFDMDGTLLNSLRDIGEAANRMLEFMNLPVHPLEAYRYFVGEGAKRLIEQILPSEQRTDDLLEQCVTLFQKEYGQSWNVHSVLYPGICQLLDALQTLPISKSILSNKPDGFTRSCASFYLNRWDFKLIMGSSETIPRKPDPTGALLIAKQLDLNPNQFIFVGDTKIDMVTASRAGMLPIGVLWGFRSEEELLENGAKGLLKQPRDLLNYLSKA